MTDTLGWIATAVFVGSYFFKPPALLRAMQMVGRLALDRLRRPDQCDTRGRRQRIGIRRSGLHADSIKAGADSLTEDCAPDPCLEHVELVVDERQVRALSRRDAAHLVAQLQELRRIAAGHAHRVGTSGTPSGLARYCAPRSPCRDARRRAGLRRRRSCRR